MDIARVTSMHDFLMGNELTAEYGISFLMLAAEKVNGKCPNIQPPFSKWEYMPFLQYSHLLQEEM